MSAALTLRSVYAQGGAAGAGKSARSLAETKAENPVEFAFYRKYTEGMLRRYMYQSMEIGRMPSMLGNCSFRGKSSNGRRRSFEDSVIFVHDIETCLKRLDGFARELVGYIALQEYTQAEAAERLGLSVRTVVRRYADALDKLTAMFLQRDLLETWEKG